jgi:hypothetical protein
VAFESNATELVPNDHSDVKDIFVKDLTTGALVRASVAPNTTPGNADSVWPSISADGRYVAFLSSATNLIHGDTNGSDDIFVKDLTTGALTRVTTSAGGTQANSASVVPTISADGRYVAFTSAATNLVSGDTNGYQDNFVKDRLTGAIERVSVSATGEQGDNWSTVPHLSADGRVVSFFSLATNLINGDTNGTFDVYVAQTPNTPGAPSNLAATALSSSRVDLTWVDNFTGEDGFEVWLSTDGGAFSLLTTLARNVQYFRHSGFSGSHTFAYQVRAILGVRETDFSNTATALVLAQPLGLNSQALNSGQIFIKWNDNATNEAVYEIWRGVGGGALALLHTAPANTPQYTDSTVAANQTYTYQVRCRNGAHVSSFTNVDTSPAMLAPTGLTGGALSSTQVDLDWTDNSAGLETSFQIFRRQGGGAWKLIGTTGANGTSYLDSTIQSGQSYEYRVRAASSNDWSSYSNTLPVIVP